MLNITFKNVQKIPTLFYETACLLFLCWKTNSILNIGKKCKHIHARVNFSIFPNKRFVWNKALKIVLIRPSSYHVIINDFNVSMISYPKHYKSKPEYVKKPHKHINSFIQNTKIYLQNWLNITFAFSLIQKKCICTYVGTYIEYTYIL